VTKTISKPKENVKNVSFRDDGKMLAACGDDEVQPPATNLFHQSQHASLTMCMMLMVVVVVVVFVIVMQTIFLFDEAGSSLLRKFRGHKGYVALSKLQCDFC
jgi:maltodextrin utilization protein YvdJ